MTKMVHFEIPVDDTGKARAFWGGLFGWEFEAYPGPFEYHMARVDEQSGVAISQEARRGPRTYFDVDDINASAAQVKELGGESSDPMPVPGMGWFATCKDDQGNEFGLWQSDENAPTPDL